jgi:hypothetical protein
MVFIYFIYKPLFLNNYTTHITVQNSRFLYLYLVEHPHISNCESSFSLSRANFYIYEVSMQTYGCECVMCNHIVVKKELH